MRSFILILFFGFNLLTLFGQEAEDAFKKANDLYGKKEYEKAAVIYKDLLEKGYSNSEIYYNLGNAYYKMEMIPEAILFYEKAKKTDPDDEDVQLNLRMAKLQTVDKIEQVPKVFYVKWYESLLEHYHSSLFSGIMIVFIWLLFMSLAGFLKFRRPVAKKTLFAFSGISLVIVILSFTLAVQSHEEEKTKDEGIIFSTSVYVKSSPDEEGTNLFILHEGTKAEVLDEVDNWEKIRIANGNVGWVPNGTLEMI